jgi:hypothetical protein
MEILKGSNIKDFCYVTREMLSVTCNVHVTLRSVERNGCADVKRVHRRQNAELTWEFFMRIIRY